MICIVLREVHGANSWRGRRSVEIIGHHDTEEEVHILLALYMENLLDSGIDNYLEVLHPGNVKGELVQQPWPFPPHPDEVHERESSIFSSIYEKAFKFYKKNGELYQTNGLSAWDSWCKTEKERVTIWPMEEKSLKEKYKGFRRLYPAGDEESFAPFTSWELGPFTKKGPVLIAFNIFLSGETYRELVTRERVFTVDGPERLLSRIAYGYIPRLDMGEQGKWGNRLKPFRNYIRSFESYDVVLLGRNVADEVKVVQSSWVSEAPLQLASRDVGVRYLTANSSFTLTLEYMKKYQRPRRLAEARKSLARKV